jgi:hypothetical protein
MKLGIEVEEVDVSKSTEPSSISAKFTPFSRALKVDCGLCTQDDARYEHEVYKMPDEEYVICYSFGSSWIG